MHRSSGYGPIGGSVYIPAAKATFRKYGFLIGSMSVALLISIGSTVSQINFGYLNQLISWSTYQNQPSSVIVMTLLQLTLVVVVGLTAIATLFFIIKILYWIATDHYKGLIKPPSK